MDASLNLLHDKFSLAGFRTGQREIIEAVLAGQDVMAVLPTGGGKSLCYQFVAVQTAKLVVVISPLIALMRDQVMGLHRLGLRAGCLHAGQSDDEKRQIFRDMAEGGAYVLYLSPERAHKAGFKTWILKQNVALFAIDEAHCVSQWGHDFREEYQLLSQLKTLRPDVPTLALTASATPIVLDDIEKSLALVQAQRQVHGFYRPNLYYQVEVCADEDEKNKFIFEALGRTPEGRILVYCGTRKQTEALAAMLSPHIPQVGFYHAGLSTEERNDVQRRYVAGDLRILVATNAFGMGIDQPDVRLVVHYQLPANIDSLYQEMGRAGRDGKPSTCLLLYSKADKGLQSYFITNAQAPKAILKARWQNLDALVAYAEGGECRHAEILAYYKDRQRLKKCGHCDGCDASSSRRVPRVAALPVAVRGAKVEKKKTVRRVREASANVDSFSGAQLETLKNLKAWRLKVATELDQPAFVIFSDKTLRDLVAKSPRSLDDLRHVYGFGPAKIERFGSDILRELNAT